MAESVVFLILSVFSQVDSTFLSIYLQILRRQCWLLMGVKLLSQMYESKFPFQRIMLQRSSKIYLDSIDPQSPLYLFRQKKNNATTTNQITLFNIKISYLNLRWVHCTLNNIEINFFYIQLSLVKKFANILLTVATKALGILSDKKNLN